MDELNQPLTPVEQSRADTGYRYYSVKRGTYNQLSRHVDETRGYPLKVTQRGIPLFDDLPQATDGSGGLIAVDCWRFTAADDAVISQAVDFKELTKDEFIAIKPEVQE